MSEWDFLWEVEGAEREFAIATGLTYADMAYLAEQEEKERKRAELQRIKTRNKAWAELKKLRDNGSLSPEEFKKRKNEIFALEIEQKKLKKMLVRKLKEIHTHSENNRYELLGSVKCACFCCMSVVFVYNLSYDGDTAVCPRCCKKSIIQYSDEFLPYIDAMHDYYYPNENPDKYDDIYN